MSMVAVYAWDRVADVTVRVYSWGKEKTGAKRMREEDMREEVMREEVMREKVMKEGL